MSFGQPCDEFPLSSLPPLIRDAVIEAQQITQAPLGLVAASALGAVSLVCQNLIDVCRLNTLRGPVSLFFLTLAESGERKTAVDKLLMKPLYQQEMQLYSRYKSELAVWKNKEELLKAQKKALLSNGFAPIFPDTCYHLTHYWPAAADIPVASDNPVHYADAIRYNARTPLQGSLLPLTRLV